MGIWQGIVRRQRARAKAKEREKAPMEKVIMERDIKDMNPRDMEKGMRRKDLEKEIRREAKEEKERNFRDLAGRVASMAIRQTTVVGLVGSRIMEIRKVWRLEESGIYVVSSQGFQ